MGRPAGAGLIELRVLGTTQSEWETQMTIDRTRIASAMIAAIMIKGMAG